ncbi:MAG: GPW/gp25 family protein [bacterium]
MTTINEIKSVDWQLKLNETASVVEGIDDIDQCILIILSTKKGSVPHRPEFGSYIWQYIDSPVNEAVPNIIREVIDSIALWEPRVEITSVTAEIINSQVKINIGRKIKNTDISGKLELIL